MEQTEILNYITSFDNPADIDFFGEKQKAQIEKENAKLKKTEDYITAIELNPGLGGRFDQDAATGVVYSPGEVSKVQARHRALEFSGPRQAVPISLITPTGQKIIISDYFADQMGFISDFYLVPIELESAVATLQAEGVHSEDLDKLKSALDANGAVVIQMGAYQALYDLLSEAVDYDLSKRPNIHAVPIENISSTAVTARPTLIKSADESFARELKKELETPELDSHQEIDLPLPDKTQVQTPSIGQSIAKPSNPIPKPSMLRSPIAPTIPKPRLITTPNLRQADILSPLPPDFGKSTLRPSPSKSNSSLGVSDLHAVHTLDDLKKLEIAHLRQGDLNSQVVLIKNLIQGLAQANKVLPFYAVNAFEQSSLFKAYLSAGLEKVSGKPISSGLSQQEFEAIADLRKQLEEL